MILHRKDERISSVGVSEIKLDECRDDSAFSVLALHAARCVTCIALCAARIASAFSADDVQSAVQA